jgi:IS4 transposase
LFPWAQFRRHKAAVKLHTLLDMRGAIPSVIVLTSGKVHDVNILDQLAIEPGTIYVMDRGYVDFERLYRIEQGGAFFVTRAKSNFRFRRLASRPVDKSGGLQCDQTVGLKGVAVRKTFPDALRRIRHLDTERAKRLVFLTNHFDLPAGTVAQLYRCRWKVELFFKWIKQHLRIRAFYGTSENAVRSQVWIAIVVYVLVAIMKKELQLDQSRYTILAVLDATITEKLPILQAFSRFEYTIHEGQ